jgi:RNA polymerase sigma-70 factor (sigma-E family)
MAGWPAPPAFEDFVRTRHVELLRFAHVLCGDPHQAADLVQDALERTGLAWQRLRRQDDPEGYVRRAILNGYLSRRRRLRREHLADALPDVGRDDPEPRDEQLWQRLAELPRQQRAVIVLRYYLDWSEAQIAAQLGCSTGTVKSTAARAMSKLRESLAPSTVDGGTR